MISQNGIKELAPLPGPPLKEAEHQKQQSVREGPWWQQKPLVAALLAFCTGAVIGIVVKRRL